MTKRIMEFIRVSKK